MIININLPFEDHVKWAAENGCIIFYTTVIAYQNGNIFEKQIEFHDIFTLNYKYYSVEKRKAFNNRNEYEEFSKNSHKFEENYDCQELSLEKIKPNTIVPCVMHRYPKFYTEIVDYIDVDETISYDKFSLLRKNLEKQYPQSYPEGFRKRIIQTEKYWKLETY